MVRETGRRGPGLTDSYYPGLSRGTVMPASGLEPGGRPFPSDLRRYAGLFTGWLRSRLVDGRPFFLAHAVTFGCNSRCLTCSYWKLTPRMKEDLPTVEVYQLLDEAYAAGLRGYYLFGGEPLVRKDVGALVDYAKRRGFVTAMNTNGSLLAAKAPSLRGLDIAFVSLDYYTPHHDEIRGRPGNFDEILRGVERLRDIAGTKITFVTTISTLNRDAMEPTARLAKDLGVGIAFNSIEPTMDFGLTDSVQSPNYDYQLTPAELHEFYVTALRLKRAGYPLMETEEVLEGYVRGIPWKCEFPKMFVYVAPDKKIYSCDYSFGYDLRHGSFEEYFASRAFHDHVRWAEGCNRCVRTCVRNYSYIYEVQPRHLVHLAQNAARLYFPTRSQQRLRAHPRSGVGAPVPDPPAQRT